MEAAEWKHRFVNKSANEALTEELNGDTLGYQTVRVSAHELATRIVANCPPGRERSLALTNLEQAVMWANRALDDVT